MTWKEFKGELNAQNVCQGHVPYANYKTNISNRNCQLFDCSHVGPEKFQQT